MNCIDPRFSTNTWAYMASDGWQNLYSQFTIAGGPIAAVVAPALLRPGSKSLWDNLAISIQLHQVKRVSASAIAIAAPPPWPMAIRIKTDPAFETAKLTEALRTFRAEVKKRQPARRASSASWP